MKKILIVIAAMIALAGCDETVKEVYVGSLPTEFKDCKIIRVQTQEGLNLTMARCPNSATTVTEPQGKVQLTTITVDGVTYEKKEK